VWICGKSGEHKVFRRIEIFEDGRKIRKCVEKQCSKEQNVHNNLQT
jgi:hypothetical protein